MSFYLLAQMLFCIITYDIIDTGFIYCIIHYNVNVWFWWLCLRTILDCCLCIYPKGLEKGILCQSVEEKWTTEGEKLDRKDDNLTLFSVSCYSVEQWKIVRLNWTFLSWKHGKLRFSHMFMWTSPFSITLTPVRLWYLSLSACHHSFMSAPDDCSLWLFQAHYICPVLTLFHFYLF